MAVGVRRAVGSRGHSRLGQLTERGIDGQQWPAHGKSEAQRSASNTVSEKTRNNWTPETRIGCELSMLLRLRHHSDFLLALMHHCLRVDELIRLIARELVADGGHATAVSLACCCKSFENLALDALWEIQDQLDPLLGTLPEDVWRPRPYDVSVAMMSLIFSLLNYLNRKTIKRPPTKQEWDRLGKYAQKMQNLSEMSAPPSELLSVLHLCASGKSLLPNLKTLEMGFYCDSVPFISSFLSTKTTAIDLEFPYLKLDLDKVMAASMITTLPKLCPNLHKIHLLDLPKDPMITVAVSELVLNTNQDTLRYLHVDSSLTGEACKVIYKHPHLRTLQTFFDGPDALPTIDLPNLTNIQITCHGGYDWLQGFHQASLGKLTTIEICAESNPIGAFLEAFKTVALTTSIPATLSSFRFHTEHTWRPNCRSLLPFTQLTSLVIQSSCQLGCSSTIDDDIIIDMARAMPKLKILQLGHYPCETPTGVTVKGLNALAYYCSGLSRLTIHFQVASFDQPELPYPTPKSLAPWKGCPLPYFCGGRVRMSEGSALVVALTLLRIFPCLQGIEFSSQEWHAVGIAIHRSNQLTCHSSKK